MPYFREFLFFVLCPVRARAHSETRPHCAPWAGLMQLSWIPEIFCFSIICDRVLWTSGWPRTYYGACRGWSSASDSSCLHFLGEELTDMRHRNQFMVCVVLGIKLLAYYMLGKHPANWAASPDSHPNASVWLNFTFNFEDPRFPVWLLLPGLADEVKRLQRPKVLCWSLIYPLYIRAWFLLEDVLIQEPAFLLSSGILTRVVLTLK